MIAGQELRFCDARGQEAPPAGWHLSPWGKPCCEAPSLVPEPVSAGLLPARCHPSWLCLLSGQWLKLSKSHSPHCFHGSKAAMTISLKSPVHSRGSEILLYFSCPFFSLKNLSLKEIQRGLLFPENREKTPVWHLLLKRHFVVVKLPFSLKKNTTKKTTPCLFKTNNPPMWTYMGFAITYNHHTGCLWLSGSRRPWEGGGGKGQRASRSLFCSKLELQ